MGWRVPGLSLVLLGFTVAALHAQQAIAPEMKVRIDAEVKRVMDSTGVPSAQVGVVLGGKVVYTTAFGKARLNPEVAAAPSMHYPVGSISKQFTAACVLLLVQDGKMTLDDSVAHWFPELTRAKDVTVRMLLSHTSGYSDYAPQDYTIPAWTKPIDPLALVREWRGSRWTLSREQSGSTAIRTSCWHR